MTDAYDLCILIHIRTTINLDETLYREAARAAGTDEKTRLIHLGLRELIRLAAARRLARLGGTMKRAKSPPRRRFRLHLDSC